MNSPYFGWVVPNSIQEDLFYGEEQEELSYQEQQALEEERSLTRAGY